MPELQDLTIDSFRPLVGTEFHIEAGDGQRVPLTLKSVESLVDKGMRRIHREPFALNLIGPSTPFVPQQMVPLTHATLGALTIFIVPLGKTDDGGYHYEAVFT